MCSPRSFEIDIFIFRLEFRVLYLQGPPFLTLVVDSTSPLFERFSQSNAMFLDTLRLIS